MPTYKTPDVYVEEISVFPPSVAEVETAVPAFIGYTERDTYKGKSYRNEPTRVTSLAEYKEIFSGGPSLKITEVKLKDDNSVDEVKFKDQYYMYDSLELFYANGGGKCYIISVGNFGATISRVDLKEGLKKLALEDEPTLILFPDAPLLIPKTDLYALQQDALSQAAELMDRFVIMDLHMDSNDENDFEDFRNNIGVNNLKYGAAYMPYLKTALPKKIYLSDLLDSSGESVIKKQAKVDPADLTASDEVKARLESYKNLISFERDVSDLTEIGGVQHTDIDEAYKALSSDFYSNSNQANFNKLLEYVYGLLKAADKASELTNKYIGKLSGAKKTAIENASIEKYIKDKTTASTDMLTAVAKLNSYIVSAPSLPLVSAFLNTPGNITATKDDGTVVGSADASAHTFSAEWGTTFTNITDMADATTVYGAAGGTEAVTLQTVEPHYRKEFEIIRTYINDLNTAADSLSLTFEDLITMQIPSYKNIKDFISKEEATIPPSGTIAGVYSYVDRTRGVWKAPANVSLNSVNGVTEKIDNKAQEELNVDVVAGKSINAIRSFAGKGVLVWGARTLAGNDNEWRYISVRRFFNMVEESCKKSTYWAVFEPNDANLWIKVKAMLENYLIEKWRDGALAGAKPEHAFFVNVGLGKTMTAQDILEGRLIIEIGMAAVRPAEFIILRFMHKMQES